MEISVYLSHGCSCALFYSDMVVMRKQLCDGEARHLADPFTFILLHHQIKILNSPVL